MFKYELEQVIYYMIDSKVHSAPVMSRCIVENAHEDWAHTAEQKGTFTAFGPAKRVYSTCHCIVGEEFAFATKEELVASL
jgi:hypothetical protein